MKRTLITITVIALLGVTSAAARAEEEKGGGRKILEFSTMYGVDGPFVNNNQIRGILGDELPWEIGHVSGSLGKDGRLNIEVKGLVFANDPSVPINLRGINDEDTFRALVSCLSEGAGDQITTVNITTGGFKATKTGDSHIQTRVELPKSCVAPVIFILSGSEDKWFSVTGAETGE